MAARVQVPRVRVLAAVPARAHRGHHLPLQAVGHVPLAAPQPGHHALHVPAARLHHRAGQR